jgi:hypothetical protein
MKKGEMHPLRIARCRHNLTIVGLAEEAKVGASTIWRAEHHYSVNAESRRRLCAFFDTAPQELGLLGRSKQSLTFEQNRLTLYPFIEPCPPVYVAEKVPVAQLAQLLTLSEGTDVRQFVTQHEQPVTLEMSSLAALLDINWTPDTLLDALRIVFQGIQLLPSRLQHTLLLGMLARTGTVPSSDSKYLLDEECSQVKEALNVSIAQSQQFCRNASPIHVLIMGQGLFYLLRQTQNFLSLESYRSFHESVTKLIESALFFQECNDSRRQVPKKEKDHQHLLTNSRNSLSPVFGQQPSFIDY